MASRAEGASPLVIACYYYPECASHEVLPALLDRALSEEGIRASVRHEVLSVADALERGIEGSPTIRINGVDILDTPSGPGT